MTFKISPPIFKELMYQVKGGHIKLYKKEVLFRETLPYAPFLQVWVTRISGNRELPRFYAPPDKITRRGFDLYYEKRKKGTFKYTYQVVLTDSYPQREVEIK